MTNKKLNKKFEKDLSTLSKKYPELKVKQKTSSLVKILIDILLCREYEF